MTKGRKQRKIELLGCINSENLDIWEDEAKESENGKFTLLVFKFPRKIKPTWLESLFNKLDEAKSHKDKIRPSKRLLK